MKIRSGATPFILAMSICACAPTHDDAQPASDAGRTVSPEAPHESKTAPTQSPPMNPNLAATDPTAQLANLSASGALDLGREEVRTYVKATFGTHCGPMEGLPFDRVCQYFRPESSDPSPWPDLMIGIRGERIVAAVVTPPAQQLGGWRCDAVPGFEHVRACAAPGVPDEDHEAWLTQWAAFFKTAD